MDNFYTCKSTVHDYTRLLNCLKAAPMVKVGDEDTSEISPFIATFLQPQYKIIDPPRRNLNYAYGLVELLDILTDSNPGLAPRFNSRISDWLLDGEFPGHYGPRFNVQHNKTIGFWWSNKARGLPTQLARCYQELLERPTSRRATITVHNPILENYNSKDVACTMDLQFLIRGDGVKRLDLIAHMRSSDALWGFCYDTLHFQMLQMFMVSWLNAEGLRVEPGFYHHVAGSFHYYHTRHAQVNEIVSAPLENNIMVPLLIENLSPAAWRERIVFLNNIAKRVAYGESPPMVEEIMHSDLGNWTRQNGLAITAYYARKYNDRELAAEILEAVDRDYDVGAWILRWLRADV